MHVLPFEGPPLKRFFKGWNKASKIADWHKKEMQKHPEMSRKRKSHDSWLDENSIVTDKDFDEEV